MTNETYDFGIAIPYDSDQDRILSEKEVWSQDSINY